MPLQRGRPPKRKVLEPDPEDLHALNKKFKRENGSADGLHKIRDVKTEDVQVDDKKFKLEHGSLDDLRKPHPFADEAEENGIVLRKYYPHEMSNARALAYNSNKLPRPIEVLQNALTLAAEVRKRVKPRDAVVHWFKMDLRTTDNRGLWLAGQKAKEGGVPLICLYIISPQDFEAHLTAPVRVDFQIRTLRVLQRDLAALGIPLYVERIEKRKRIPGRVLELLEEWRASHLFANMEYEVDELRRDAQLVTTCAEKGIDMEVVHDTCVVPPGILKSGTGNQYSVYSPWRRAWVAHLHANPGLLDTFEPPPQNPSSVRQSFAALFDCEIPEAPQSKRLSEDDATRLHAVWPAGEHEAMARLEKFCEEKIGQYHAARNIPFGVSTSNISAHLAAGTLSARTAVRYARDRNKTKKLDAGMEGIQTWISEVAWRDFYKHVLVNWPYVWYVLSPF